MTSDSIRYVLIFFLLGLRLTINAQSTSSLDADLRSYFIKPEMEAQVGQLEFNVIRVVNTGDTPVTIKPLLEVPKGFAIFTSSLQETTIAAGDSVIFPFRIKVSNEASASQKHELKFRAFDRQNQLILENNLEVQPIEVHDWDIEIPRKSAYFYPRFNLAEFDIVVKNNGNTPELINLNINPSNNLELKGVNGKKWQEDHIVYIPPNTDSIIRFKANYTMGNDRTYDLSKVNIYANVGDKKIYRAITIEKYSDEYDPFFIDHTLPHTVEAGVRSGNLKNDYSPFVNAQGYSEFKNQSSFQYYYSNYLLNQPENWLRNSNYRFLYTKNKFKAGLGAFGSQLGRNIYSQNALMLAYGLDAGKNNQFEVYASQDYLDPITSGAVGHEFNNNKWNLKSAVGYNYDALRKTNTSSIKTMTNQLPLFKGTNLTAYANAIREDYYLVNRFTLQGFGWDINWAGRLGSRFNYQLRNIYGSPEIPTQQMGMLGFYGKFGFKTLTNRNFWSSNIYSIRRKFNEYNLLGEQTPEILLKDSYANILFNSHSNPKFTYSIGPSIELYESHRPALKDFAYADYDLKKFHLEMSFILNRSISIAIEGGMLDINYSGDMTIDETKPDVHINATYNKNGFGVNINYNYGPLVNRGLYQYPSDMNYNGIIISPYIYDTYWNERIKLQVYTSFNYRQDLNFYYANVSPDVEIYLIRNWYFHAKGNYSYYMQDNNEFVSQNSNYYAQFSIKKKFGKSDFYNKEKDLKRLKVVCFKDENNNGKRDNGEAGIEMIKVRMKFVDEAKPGKETFPIDISLLTNDKGNVIFNRIPKGFYQLEVDPLGNMQEYFYVSEEHEYVELLKNKTFFIPFQKANRIVGRIDIDKTKYSNENPLDLESIKVTAYNQAGNSFSSFTLKDGSFTLFAPGDTIYYIRLNNIFSDKYKLVANDIMKRVPDPSNTPVVFKVVEKTRKINFKKANKKQVGSDALKIKVLEGKIYENTDERISKDAEPDFDIGGGTSFEINLKVGKHYVILAKTDTEDQAVDATFKTMDKGLDTFFGYDEKSKKYFIVTGEYSSAFDAQTAAQQARDAGLTVIETLFYK